MRAAYSGIKELVEMLLEKGANKDIIDNEGRKAIHYVRTECLGDLKDILK